MPVVREASVKDFMSSAELASLLDEMADTLRQIRRNDETGWVDDAKAQLLEAEHKLRMVGLWFERR